MNGRASNAVHTDHGVIAQLGERLNGIQEVGGSIPPGSTIQTVEIIRQSRGGMCRLF